MGLMKAAWASDNRKRERIETMREGFDYSGLKRKYRSTWLCRECSSIVVAGERHGHRG